MVRQVELFIRWYNFSGVMEEPNDVRRQATLEKQGASSTDGKPTGICLWLEGKTMAVAEKD